MSNSQYRPCVGICLINQNREVFVGNRIDTPGEAWQMPQGGIDKAETIQKAALRELAEETAITSIKILKETEDWLSYDLPKSLQGKCWGGDYVGQKQKWVLVEFTGKEDEINLQTSKPEFRAWQWMSAAEVLKKIVPFKKKLYQTIFKNFNLL